MNYFNSLPLITATDLNGNKVVVNNLLARAYFLPSLLKNISVFYDYNVREGDTPEIIAHKYYGNVYRYWLVLFSNGIIDPQSQWPLSDAQFNSYLENKYKIAANGNPVISYTLSTVHHYEQIISTTDDTNLQSTNISVVIDANTYNSLMETKTQKALPNGVVITREISKKAVSIYNYEVGVNEEKRKINLMKDIYASDAERQFIRLMSR